MRDGETGLLVMPGDLASLTEALRRLIGDGSLRVRLGAGAAALARDQLDAAANAQRIGDILTEVALSRGRSV